ncbi:MAG TPA: 3-deoxy-8-phosphooctulonate synthase [Fimbriimonadaceae bacterium]|nr:3-deoxy-8-phosphooctulonate synthase [Fimbriimonadaceae bacterium]
MAGLHLVEQVRVGPVTVGAGSLVLIAGPCLAESLELCRRVAGHMIEVTSRLGMPYVFKASFDKANRSGANAARGEGIDAGLAILRSIKDEFGLPVTTDVHTSEQAHLAAQVADLLQIPAFLCRQTDLLEACAATGRPVNVKKGQFLAPWDAKNIVDKLRAAGAVGAMLTERGTTFGYNALVVDMPGLETMRSYGVPICFDATHSAQRPGALGASTGGARGTIPAMSRAAAAVGIDALFVETHPEPNNALSDSTTQWPLADIEPLLARVLEIDRAARASA